MTDEQTAAEAATGCHKWIREMVLAGRELEIDVSDLLPFFQRLLTPRDEKIERLEKENKILEKKNSTSLANNLCPDCRDKISGLSCLRCEVQRLRNKNRELNRRWQEADKAFRETKVALDNNWTWKGGNFGRALLAYHCSCLEKEIERLNQQLERMRLERDMLALNSPGGNDSPPVFVVYGDDGNVAGVAWSAEQTASEPLIRFPAWYEQQLAETTKKQTDA